MGNFQRVWIVSGIIFGLGMSALDAFLYDRNLLFILLVGVVSGSVSGLCFGVIAHYLSRSENTSCLTGFLLTLAGFLLGIGSFIGLGKLPHGQWEQIISPPEKSVRFIGQSAFTFWGGSV